MRIIRALNYIIFAVLMSGFAGLASAGMVHVYNFVDNSSAWSYGGYNTGGTGPGWSGGYGDGYGPELSFTSDNGLDTTAWFIEDGYWAWGYHGHGLGVYGWDGSAKKVDNDGEGIVFGFEHEVRLLSSFYWSYGRSSDVGILYWDEYLNDWLLYDEFHFGKGYEEIGAENDHVVSKYFAFVNTDGGKKNDKWVMKGLAVEKVFVTEPLSLSLIGIGLIGLVFSRRRATF